MRGIGASCEENVRATIESAWSGAGGDLKVEERRPTIPIPF